MPDPPTEGVVESRSVRSEVLDARGEGLDKFGVICELVRLRGRTARVQAAEFDASDIAAERPVFDGTDGLRWVSWSTASSSLEGNFERSPSASELLDIDSSWSEYLEYEDFDGTTLVDLEWETGDLYEVWQDGEVIGHVGVNYAEVNYFDSSDPDPISVLFSVIVALDSDEFAVREWTGIY